MEKTEGSGGGACLESSLAPAVGGRRWAVERLAGGEKGFLVEEISREGREEGKKGIIVGRRAKGRGRDRYKGRIGEGSWRSG